MQVPLELQAISDRRHDMCIKCFGGLGLKVWGAEFRTMFLLTLHGSGAAFAAACTWRTETHGDVVLISNQEAHI